MQCVTGGSTRTRRTVTKFKAVIFGRPSATPAARGILVTSQCASVAPGDLIFSFMDTRILAIGIAQSYSWECPKPQEFGNAEQNWEDVGWKVKVNFTELANKIRPKDHINICDRFSPRSTHLFNRMETAYNLSTLRRSQHRLPKCSSVSSGRKSRL